jgi:CheY-like chemotaxis protein
VFRIELPRQAPRAADHTAVAAQPGPPVRERKILVVDDEVDVADVLAAMLETDKHRVETAKNGVEALDRINVAAFDAIICDLRMPELDGPDLYGEIERRHPALLGRFVFLTGDTLDARIAEFLSQTDAPTVNKPFSLEEVRAAIQRVLGPR